MKNTHNDKMAKAGENIGTVSCETLLRLPDCRLDLEKTWDKTHTAHYAFTLYPYQERSTTQPVKGIRLLAGQGHEVSRRDLHHAFYLLQSFRLKDTVSQRVLSA
jgi:hypothetical protein